MAEKTDTAQQEFTFHADWESCDRKVTYKPKWASVGTTPGTLRISPGRAYRVSVRPDTTPADLDEILRAVPGSNIRTIRIPHGGSIDSAVLGKALAKLKGVETVGMYWPFHALSWLVSIGLAKGQHVQCDLENWPVDEVTAALGQIPRANEVTINMDDFKDAFSLTPLFRIRELKRVHIDHASYSEQELDWTGLSAQGKVQYLNVRDGFLNAVFWTELGTLRKLREIEMWWPEKAKAKAGSLCGLASLKTLKGVCLFNEVPEAFQAFAECPVLENVKIQSCNINDASAAGIGAMAKLKDCHIWGTELTDAGMQAMCRWPKIHALVLCEKQDNPTPITRAGFESLANLKTLKTLQLQGFDAVAAEGWATLRRLPRLKQLKVMSRPAFDVMEAIGPVPSLEKLTLSYCSSIGPAGIRQLKSMPRLKSLTFHVNRYHPYHLPLSEIGELRGLTSVLLGGLHKMTDDQLGCLAGLRNLQELCLYETEKVSDGGVANLSNLKKLRVVTLFKLPKLTDQTVKTLLSFPHLETLLLRCTGKITDKGLAGMGARRLTTLHLQFARNLTGDGLLHLARKLPLKELTVDSSPYLTDKDVLTLAAHPTLKRVAISGCKNVSKDIMKTLAEMRPDWKSPAFNFWAMM